MIGGPVGFIEFLHEAFAWLAIGLEIAGLIVCIRYLRLSSAMFLLVLAFAGFAGASVASRVLTYALRMQGLPDELIPGLFAVTHLVNVAATAALVVGLYAVFRDLRERFHFVREVHEGRREP
ncbi:MAG: hypothetical protein ACT4QC_12515 [Planctomycetaceae bacterium]